MPKFTISLKAARINAEKEQDEVAKYVGVTTKTIQNYENGKTIPAYDTVEKMCEFYGIEMSYIFLGRKSAKSV
ncbi:MAG: helix-turn-helix transcriptional regulator [Candidatus Dehalobacter alkaniphilus]